MRTVLTLLLLGGLAVVAVPEPAAACGGFFCGRSPVDQQAERILFAVGEDETTMIVQIDYMGSAADFAWVLPLGAVPVEGSLATFPQLALTALDANTGPQFQMPDDCWNDLVFAAGAEDADRSGQAPPVDGSVIVHIREEVGPYDVAVIESTDPDALVTWLRANEFRVTDVMQPYIDLYTSEGMKFLALRLQPGEGVESIAPFRMTLPGQLPVVPLRVTALASEPEMGVAVFILGADRYGPMNASLIRIDDRDIKWNANTWPLQTNWTALVARAVDEAGGRGFATEMAGATEPIAQLLENTSVSDPEQQAARDALLALVRQYPYFTRLYTRLSAEEMVYDPIFALTGGADVDRNHMLPRYVDGQDMCGAYFGEGEPPSPCDFASCGAGGLCREVDVDGVVKAACACVPGATARTTFAPDGSVIVACQDQRMSFVNPGERSTLDGTPLPDPCDGFSCGGSGRCIAMNMTPTCECEQGYVATGALDADGSRLTTCTTPLVPVPDDFYDVRLPSLPATLPGGRQVSVPEITTPLPAPYAPPSHDGGCAVGGGAGGLPGALPLALPLLFLIRRRRR